MKTLDKIIISIFSTLAALFLILAVMIIVDRFQPQFTYQKNISQPKFISSGTLQKPNNF